MAEYTLELNPPEKVDLTITGTASQQITLQPGKFNIIVFDYEGDYLIFEGTNVKAIASLKTISDVFWMILSLTSKGFECKPNEPKEMLEKVLLGKPLPRSLESRPEEESPTETATVESLDER